LLIIVSVKTTWSSLIIVTRRHLDKSLDVKDQLDEADEDLEDSFTTTTRSSRLGSTTHNSSKVQSTFGEKWEDGLKIMKS
jgi:hypothetical protein